MQRGIDFFMRRSQQYLANTLNEDHLHNVIRISRDLFMISNKREFKLYNSQYQMIKVVYELSCIEEEGVFKRDKVILY